MDNDVAAALDILASRIRGVSGEVREAVAALRKEIYGAKASANNATARLARLEVEIAALKAPAPLRKRRTA